MQTQRPAPINLLEVYRRLSKLLGIYDLYTSQVEVLDTWIERKGRHDTQTILRLL